MNWKTFFAFFNLVCIAGLVGLVVYLSEKKASSECFIEPLNGTEWHERYPVLQADQTVPFTCGWAKESPQDSWDKAIKRRMRCVRMVPCSEDEK